MKLKRRGSILVNSDIDGFTKYKTIKAINEARDCELRDQQKKIEVLNNEINELKELIKGLVK